MLVGIMGKMGAGKTLTMSILATYINLKTEIPIYSNYSLKGSKPVKNIKDLWNMESAVFCFDELWITMDSRRWKTNVDLTQWVNQTRKKNLLCLYTTQHISQVEMRVRKGTDILIYCEKKPSGMWLNFIDYQYNTLGRRFLLQKPERFYDLYNTFEVVKTIGNE